MHMSLKQVFYLPHLIRNKSNYVISNKFGMLGDIPARNVVIYTSHRPVFYMELSPLTSQIRELVVWRQIDNPCLSINDHFWPKIMFTVWQIKSYNKFTNKRNTHWEWASLDQEPVGHLAGLTENDAENRMWIVYFHHSVITSYIALIQSIGDTCTMCQYMLMMNNKKIVRSISAN